MRTFAAFLLLIIICSVAVPADKLTEDQKLKVINKELQKSKQELRKTKMEEQAVLGRLVVINKELKRTKSNLFQTEKKIKVNESQIGTLTSELRDTEADLKQKESKLRDRVKEVFKSSGLNYIQLLFSSGSMSEFLNRLYFFRKIIDYDAQLVQVIRADARKVKEKKYALEKKTMEIRSLAKVITQKKNEIAVKAEEKKKIYK